MTDNTGADIRHGVEPTYKKEEGFQPLQVTWGRFVIDAVFRGGSCHSNREDTVIRTVTHPVKLIRSGYREDAVIVLTCGCGFSDQKNFKTFEKLEIYYIAAARITEDVRKTVSSVPEENFSELKKEKQTRRYAESVFSYGTRDVFRRFIFCQPLYENGHMLITSERADTLLVTNLPSVRDAEDMPEEIRSLTDAAEIIGLYHMRGASELVFRALERLRYGTDAL